MCSTDWGPKVRLGAALLGAGCLLLLVLVCALQVLQPLLVLQLNMQVPDYLFTVPSISISNHSPVVYGTCRAGRRH